VKDFWRIIPLELFRGDARMERGMLKKKNTEELYHIPMRMSRQAQTKKRKRET